MPEDQDNSNPGTMQITMNAPPTHSLGQIIEQEDQVFNIQCAEELYQIDADRIADRVAVRAQPLSEPLSELWSELLSEYSLLPEQQSECWMKRIFTCRLAEQMDIQEFHWDNLDESMAALGITMEIKQFQLLHKPTQLQPHQIFAVNLTGEKENTLVKGGLISDDCRTAKVRPCCALEIYCSQH